MKILVTGVNGLLGQKVFYKLNKGNELLICDLQEQFLVPSTEHKYRQVDITNHDLLKSIMYFYPDYVINCAAYTNVDGCETEKELSWNVNVKALEYLAYFSRVFHFHLVHISTDYVFNGKTGLYKEDDKPEPLSHYGKEKLASENAVLQHAEKYSILRTNVLFGVAYGNNLNFITWLIKKLYNNEPVNIVTDQYNNANLAEDLAWSIKAVIKKEFQGILHIGGKEYMNRYEMALEVAKILNVPETLITPIKTEQLNQAAERPLKGGLNIEKAGQIIDYKPTNLNKAIQSVISQMKKMRQI